MPIDHERMEVEQQRVLVARCSGPVPRFQIEELGVLGVDGQLVVERDVHGVSRVVPGIEFAEIEIGRSLYVGEHLGVPLGKEPDRARRVAQIESGHDVRVGVVVDDGRVLVRSGHPVDVERLGPIGCVETEVGPHASGLDQDLGALVSKEVDVTRWHRGSGAAQRPRRR